ncbi:MAG: hypothetical protein HY721_29230 [Planctomycetes bacterium]|nr:hypothetical protein [Planctomycetota bacterium]
MDLLLAGLAGVAVGALVATAILLHSFQRRADRDLIERRLRACLEYRECLGDLEKAFEGAGGDPQVVEQAWHSVAAFCREFRVTGWVLRPEVHARLAPVVEGLERERGRRATNGAGGAAGEGSPAGPSGGRAAQVLCDAFHEVDAVLRREVEAQLREHRRLRFLPELGADPGKEP